MELWHRQKTRTFSFIDYYTQTIITILSTDSRLNFYVKQCIDINWWSKFPSDWHSNYKLGSTISNKILFEPGVSCVKFYIEYV